MIRMKEVVVTVDFRVNIVCKDDVEAQIMAEDISKGELMKMVRSTARLKRIIVRKATKEDIKSLDKYIDIKMQAQGEQA